MKNEVEILKNIKRQETPPFLFTRIEERINSLENEYVSLHSIFRFGALALVILAINIAVINQKLNTENKMAQNETDLVEVLELNTSNQLYYD